MFLLSSMLAIATQQWVAALSAHDSTEHERINAVILDSRTSAIEFGQYAAAERLRVRAAQYDANADAIEALQRGTLIN